jgi:hypothetical protein
MHIKQARTPLRLGAARRAFPRSFAGSGPCH